MAHCCSSVIIDDLHLVRVFLPPNEADPPLVVNTNAPLTFPISSKFLEAIRMVAAPSSCLNLCKSKLSGRSALSICVRPTALGTDLCSARGRDALFRRIQSLIQVGNSAFGRTL